MLLDLENVNDASLTLSNPVLVNLHKASWGAVPASAFIGCSAQVSVQGELSAAMFLLNAPLLCSHRMNACRSAL